MSQRGGRTGWSVRTHSRHSQIKNELKLARSQILVRVLGPLQVSGTFTSNHHCTHYSPALHNLKKYLEIQADNDNVEGFMSNKTESLSSCIHLTDCVKMTAYIHTDILSDQEG